jgi:purine-binding chemotaxis protein CheW
LDEIIRKTGKEPSKTQLILDTVRNKAEKARDLYTLEETVELVIFTIGHRYFAIMGSDVREILPFLPITEVPGCPRTIRGIINVRGKIESVINLHTLLEMDEVPVSTATRIILGQSGELLSGIQVDQVTDVVSIEKAFIKPVISTLPLTIINYAHGGEEFYRGHYIIVLNVEKLFKTF